jgi:hypothetical protein
MSLSIYLLLLSTKVIKNKSLDLYMAQILYFNNHISWVYKEFPHITVYDYFRILLDYFRIHGSPKPAAFAISSSPIVTANIDMFYTILQDQNYTVSFV